MDWGNWIAAGISAGATVANSAIAADANKTLAQTQLQREQTALAAQQTQLQMQALAQQNTQQSTSGLNIGVTPAVAAVGIVGIAGIIGGIIYFTSKNKSNEAKKRKRE